MFKFKLHSNLDKTIDHGIYVSPKVCKSILTNNRPFIISNLNERLKEKMFLASDKLYGIIVLGQPKKLSELEFNTYLLKGHLTKDDFNCEEDLYLYPVKHLEPFQKPSNYSFPSALKSFLK